MPETRELRESEWTIEPVPPPLLDRQAEFGNGRFERSRADEARALFEEVALGDELVEF